VWPLEALDSIGGNSGAIALPQIGHRNPIGANWNTLAGGLGGVDPDLQCGRS